MQQDDTTHRQRLPAALLAMESKMKAPNNTANAGPLANLVVAMGGPRGIEAQESQGQGDLVNSDTLPTEGLERIAAALGIAIVDPVPDDALFTYVKLPVGWTKTGTDHAMWSELLDEKGRKRAAIFYKAAFYDRGAHIHAERRFSVRLDYDHEKQHGEAICYVEDADGQRRVFTSTAHRVMPPRSWEASDAARAEATAWLLEAYPDHDNAVAYWE
jgi:hypothetical protein